MDLQHEEATEGKVSSHQNRILKCSLTPALRAKLPLCVFVMWCAVLLCLTRSCFLQDGYVDGVDAGEDASLQVGFNLGFKEGAAQTVAVGRLRGIVR